MVKHIKAFTLVESLISMIIIMLVSIAILPVLTKTKNVNNIPRTTIRGQYACWVDTNGKTYEQYYDDRTPRTANPIETENCKLKLDLRPAFYYIVASGAGGTSSRGQVTTVYTDTLSNELEIKLGKTSESTVSGRTTTVKSPTSLNAEVIAKGGEDSVDNGLVPSNIKSCKLLSAGDACPSGVAGTQESCEVVQTVSGGNYVNRIRVNGCKDEDAYGVSGTKNIIAFEDLEVQGGNTGAQSLYEATSIAQNLSQSSSKTYKYGVYSLNLEFEDSSYMKNNVLLDFNNNTGNNLTNVSQMSNIIEAMPSRRISDLTKKIADLNPGAQGKSGAVLILW